MCGINGIASHRSISERGWLSLGLAAMRHRGPDHSGEWWDNSRRVGFGHCRLAIVDLSPGGHQPMQAGSATIVFNGEIYNHGELREELAMAGFVFRTSSDTEVILAAYLAWGSACLQRLHGMFAFALYDAARETVLLARDRAGEKPLFYAADGQSLRFASELKGLFADHSFERRLNPAGLDCYLYMGFVPAPHSILNGVQKLAAAHALSFDLRSGDTRTWRYWSLPEVDRMAATPAPEALVDEVEVLLEDAVRHQLMADVPVGVLLSGGLDSSLVTALAARARPRLKTFTVSFPDSPAFDESRHARLVADYFGTDHTELVAEPSSVELLPKLARHFDEPVNDSSMIPTFLVSQLIRRHCTVALGGDGGDELFGGYRHYNRLLWLERHFGRLPHQLRGPAAMAASLLPEGFKGKNWLCALDADFSREVPLIARYFDRSSRRRLLGAASERPFADDLYKYLTPAGGDLLQRATRLDFATYLPEDILVKVDRASMMNSLEVRAPFLDVPLIEFAYGKVPSALKASPNGRKVLLKYLAKRVLPEQFQLQRKQGFSIPITSWLKSGSWLQYFRDVLLDPEQRLFSHNYIEALFSGQARGRANGERLFGLVMFELWRREFRITA